MRCSTCGKDHPGEGRFCIYCGGEISTQTEAASSANAWPASTDYTQPVCDPAYTQAPTAYTQPSGPTHAQPVPDGYIQTRTGVYPAAPPTQSPKKKGLPGWAIAMIVIGAAAAVIVGGIFAISALIDSLSLDSGAGSATFESASLSDEDSYNDSLAHGGYMAPSGAQVVRGRGFDTPEEAIEAYLTAMRYNDLEAISSCVLPAMTDYLLYWEYDLEDLVWYVDEFKILRGNPIESYRIANYESYNQRTILNYKEMLEIEIEEFVVYYVTVDLGLRGVHELNIDLIFADGHWGVTEVWHGELE